MPGSTELWACGALTGELLTMPRGGPPKHEPLALPPPIAASGHRRWDGARRFAARSPFIVLPPTPNLADRKSKRAAVAPTPDPGDASFLARRDQIVRRN